MKSKIKIILVSLVLVVSVANTANAAGLGVCKGNDLDYGAYQTWLIENPRPQQSSYFYNSELDNKQQAAQYNSAVAAWNQKNQAFLAQHPGICQPKDIYKLLAKISNILVALIGLFAVFRLVVGGYLMLGFPGNEEATKEAKRILGNAMIGIVIVYAAYVVIQYIWSALGVVTNLPFPFNFFVK